MSNVPMTPVKTEQPAKFATPIAERFRSATDPNNERGRNFPKSEAPKVEATAVEASKSDEPKQAATPAESTQNIVPKEATVAPTENKPNPLAEALSKPKGKDESMAELRKSLEEERARRVQYEKDLETVKAQVPPDYEQVKKDRELLVQEIERVKIEASPRFKEKYDKPLGELADSIRRDVQYTDVKADDVLALINQPASKERNAELSKIVDGMDKITAGKVTNAIARIEELRDARASEIKNPSQAFAQMQQENQRQQELQRQQYTSALDSVLDQASKGILSEKEGNDEWNARVNQVKETARKYWLGTNNKIEDLAQLTLDGATLPVYKEALEMSRAQIESLSAELAALRGATPANGAVSSGASESGSKPVGAVAAFRQAVGNRR